MVPFFRYATGSRVTPQIQSPFSSIAPLIQYDNSEFSLIDNISVFESNFSLLETNASISLNASGEGLNEVDQPIYDPYNPSLTPEWLEANSIPPSPPVGDIGDDSSGIAVG